MGLEQWVPLQESAGGDSEWRRQEGGAPGCAGVGTPASGAVGEAARAAVLGGRRNDRSTVTLGWWRSSVRLRATAWCKLDARVASRRRKEDGGGSAALGKEGRDDGGQAR
uniref:Uncharacterized protein n=1 Tax=Oryza meridionalis TaxID=40149 RepID=A0A0E0DCH4_9ORYZ